jgi:hypothetical protein
MPLSLTAVIEARQKRTALEENVELGFWQLPACRAFWIQSGVSSRKVPEWRSAVAIVADRGRSYTYPVKM